MTDGADQDHPAAASLLARLRAGEEAAFELMVRAHASRLLGVARRFLSSEEDARDVVQEAFLAAFRNLDGFQGGAQLSTWLHRITVNAALMKLRSCRRRPEESIDELLPQFDDQGLSTRLPREWIGHAHELLEREEDRKFVRASIRKLPESYRLVLLLRDIDGWDTHETARLLDLTTGAVKVRLHRARLALRTLLAARFEVKTA
jgi:RNA polymerase sigma-70 factor (ECF subfamily)